MLRVVLQLRDCNAGLLSSSVSIAMNPDILRDGTQAPDADDQPGIVTGDGGKDIADGEHVWVGTEELLVAGVLLPDAVSEIGQGTLGIVVASMGPSSQMADTERDTEQAVASAVEDVRMTESLRDVVQESPVGL